MRITNIVTIAFFSLIFLFLIIIVNYYCQLLLLITSIFCMKLVTLFVIVIGQVIPCNISLSKHCLHPISSLYLYKQCKELIL